MKATYVSSWDNGSNKFRSSCEFNPETKKVTNIEAVDVDDSKLCYLDEEYIELPNGEIVKTFTTEDRNIVDGQLDD